MSEDKKIIEGRKIATARRSLSDIKVIRKGGAVRFSRNISLSNLTDKVADDVENTLNSWLTLLSLFLKGEAQNILEGAFDGEESGVESVKSIGGESGN